VSDLLQLSLLGEHIEDSPGLALSCLDVMGQIGNRDSLGII